MKETHDLLFQAVKMVTPYRMIGPDLLRQQNMTEENIKLLAHNYRQCLRGLLRKFQQDFSEDLDELMAIGNLARAIDSKANMLEYTEATDAFELLSNRSGCFAWLEAIKNVLELKLLHQGVS